MIPVSQITEFIWQRCREPKVQPEWVPAVHVFFLTDTKLGIVVNDQRFLCEVKELTEEIRETLLKKRKKET